MEILDPGHCYRLRTLDGDAGPLICILEFVKRMGPGYPGNADAHPGTTTQEVLRALIDRTKYVDGQIHDAHNDQVLYHLRAAILELEIRAAKRHGRQVPQLKKGFRIEEIEFIPTCEKCNHIQCEGACH